jgi:hypothetical protein
LEIETMEFEKVQSFKYLGQMLTRISKQKLKNKCREKAFYAMKKIFQYKLLSKTPKLRLHLSAIRLAVTYTCEAWVLKDNIVQKLNEV